MKNKLFLILILLFLFSIFSLSSFANFKSNSNYNINHYESNSLQNNSLKEDFNFKSNDFNSNLNNLTDLKLPGYDLKLEHNDSVEIKEDYDSKKLMIEINSVDDIFNSQEIPENKCLNELKNRILMFSRDFLSEEIEQNNFIQDTFLISGNFSNEDIFFLKSYNLIDSIHYDLEISKQLLRTKDMINLTPVRQKGFDGRGVGVCVLDTGINYKHPSFGSCINEDIIRRDYESLNLTFEKINLSSDGEKLVSLEFPNYDSISINFSNLNLSEGYISIRNEQNEEVYGISKDHKNISTGNIDTNNVKIKLYGLTDINSFNFDISGVNLYSFQDNCNKISGGWNFIDNNDKIIDFDGHGTHVSGIVSAVGLVDGIAPGTHIIPVKVLDDDGQGHASSIYSGLKYCIENRDEYNIEVITMSLGTDDLFENWCDNKGVNRYFKDIINKAISNNMIVVSASGNDGNLNRISFPACLSNTISVGSFDNINTISDFSNRNWMVDILAPGRNILSTGLDDTFEINSGTSMSTPYVAAVAALYTQRLNQLGFDSTQNLFLSSLSNSKKSIYERGVNYNILNSYETLHLDSSTFITDLDPFDISQGRPKTAQEVIIRTDGRFSYLDFLLFLLAVMLFIIILRKIFYTPH